MVTSLSLTHPPDGWRHRCLGICSASTVRVDAVCFVCACRRLIDLSLIAGSLLHAVLPGVLGFDTDAVAESDQAAINELRSRVKSGQQRMSLNLAFWETPCMHQTPICQEKNENGKSKRLWGWEKVLPPIGSSPYKLSTDLR